MPNQQAELDQVFHALSDPTRRAVLKELTEGPATVSDLARPFEMALPSFLQHLKVLETGGLIRTRKKGRVRICEIEPRMLDRAETWLARQRAAWEALTDRLAAYVEDLHSKEN